MVLDRWILQVYMKAARTDICRQKSITDVCNEIIFFGKANLIKCELYFLFMLYYIKLIEKQLNQVLVQVTVLFWKKLLTEIIYISIQLSVVDVSAHAWHNYSRTTTHDPTQHAVQIAVIFPSMFLGRWRNRSSLSSCSSV